MVIGEAPQPSSISSFAIDPGHSERVLAAATTSGLLGSSTIFQSHDAGETWLQVATFSSTDILALAYHPSRAGTVFAVGVRWRCFQAPCFPLYSRLGSVILRSVDSGATWNDVTDGLVRSGSPIVAVAFDSTAPDRIYAAGDGGVFVSEDGGAQWMLSVSGMEGCPAVTSLAMRADGVLFAGVGRFTSHRFDCGGVFRSSDGGRSWSATGPGPHYVTSVTIDPTNPRTMYAGAARPGFFSPDGGVFRTTDGGENWSPFGAGLPFSGVSDLVVEPSGRVLHAATAEGVFDYEIVPGARPPVTLPRDRETRTLPGRP